MRRNKTEEARIAKIVNKLIDRDEKDAFIAWLKENKYWKEFAVSGELDKQKAINLLKKHEEKVTVWINIDKEHRSAQLSFIHPDNNERDRFIFKTDYYCTEDLININELGRLSILEGPEKELAVVRYNLRKAEKLSRILRKKKDTLEAKYLRLREPENLINE